MRVCDVCQGVAFYWRIVLLYKVVVLLCKDCLMDFGGDAEGGIDG